MTQITRQLNGEVGIEINDIVADDLPIANQTNILMIIQDVPRGRTDKIMTITKSNMYQKLGRRIGSMYLQAITDALDIAPSVMTLRVIDDKQMDISEILYNNTIRYDGKFKYNN